MMTVGPARYRLLLNLSTLQWFLLRQIKQIFLHPRKTNTEPGAVATGSLMRYRHPCVQRIQC